MIALAESLVRCGVVDEDDLARTLQAVFDPERGYGSGMHELVGMWRQGVPRAEAAGRLFDGRGSLGNGAAMRVAPVAAWFCEDEVLLAVQVRRSARVTHAHEQGIAGALAQAAAVAAALEDRDPITARVPPRHHSPRRCAASIRPAQRARCGAAGCRSVGSSGDRFGVGAGRRGDRSSRTQRGGGDRRRG